MYRRVRKAGREFIVSVDPNIPYVRQSVLPDLESLPIVVGKEIEGNIDHVVRGYRV